MLAKNLRFAFLATTLAVLPLAPAPAASTSEEDRVQSQTYVQDARDYLTRGDYKSAVIQLKNALKSNPDNVEARFLLGGIYLKTGDGASAEKEFRSARRRGMDESNIAAPLAQAYLLQGKYHEVIEELQGNALAQDLPPDHAVLVGQAQYGLRQFEDAEATFTAVLNSHPEHTPTLLGLARLKISQRDRAAGETHVDAALALDPRNVNGLILKGELRRFARDFEASARFFSSALEVQPGNAMAKLGRAAVYIDLRRDDDAQADIDEVLKTAPRHPLASHLSAVMLVRQREYQKAHDRLTEAGSALRDFIPSVFLLGTINYAQNQLEQAEANLSRVVTVSPDNVLARQLLGATLLRKNDTGEAVRVLEPVRELAPDNARVLSLLATAYLRNKQYAEGTELFERVAELAPDQAGIRTQLAIGRLSRGLPEQAVRDLETAIDLDPDSRQAAILLVLVHLKNGAFDDALTAARTLSEQMPDNPLPFNLVGAALQGKGDLPGARAQFEKALTIKADYFPAHRNLASLEIKAGNVAAAVRRYEALLEADPKNIRAHIALSDLSIRSRKLDEAISWLEKARVAAPNSPAIGLRLVSLYVRRGEAEKSLTLARELERATPEDPRALEALGRAQSASQDLAGAVTTFRRLVDKLPDRPEPLLMLARAQAASQNLGGARRSLLRAIDLRTDYIPAKIELVKVSALDGRIDEALTLADEITAAQPNTALGNMLKGDVLVNANRHQEAADAYVAAQAKQPSAALAVRLFNARMKTGAKDRAVGALSEWLEQSPDDQATRHVLAGAYLGMKRYDDAIGQYMILSDGSGKNPVILNNLAWLYQQKGDPKALEYAEQAYQMAPKSAAIVDTLGWILVDNGQYARALELLRQATILAPQESEIRYHLAVALHKSGRNDDARQELEEILRLGKDFGSAAAARDLLRQLSK